ncbi:hypothetical protein [Ehrlichia ruminantium]|nr:hypothetical protein [Ehrlichia ruminantium]
MLYPPDNIKDQVTTGQRALSNINNLSIDIPSTNNTQFKEELTQQLEHYQSQDMSNPTIAKHLRYFSQHFKTTSPEELFRTYKDRIILGAAFEKTITKLKSNLILAPQTIQEVIYHIGYTGFTDNILNNILNPDKQPTYYISNHSKKIRIIPSSQYETVFEITSNISICEITNPKKKYTFNTKLSFCILLQNNKLSYTQTLFSLTLPNKIKEHITNKKRTAIEMATNPLPTDLSYATLNYTGQTNINRTSHYIIEYAMPNPKPLDLTQLNNPPPRILDNTHISNIDNPIINTTKL